MLAPTLEAFTRLAEDHDRVTVYREIGGDTLTPILLLRNFSNEKHVFLLESANVDKSFSRFSFFGRKPRRIITFENGQVVIENGGKKVKSGINPMDFLNNEFSAENGYHDRSEYGDFGGGFVGFFGYDAVNYMGVLRTPVKEAPDEKLIGFFEVDEFYVFDNHLQRAYAAIAVQVNGDPAKAYRAAEKRTRKMAEEVFSVNFDSYASTIDPDGAAPEYDESVYYDKVNAIKEEITKGEAIQVVFSNKYEIDGTLNPVSFYRALRNVNPSPYMFFLKFGDSVLCGSSPEIHLKVREEVATLKPIAGTCPISDDIPMAKQKLLGDEKELSEHLMLLDLARNDLYTSCAPDSVEVTQHFEPEVYSHVIHIVSTVTGRLNPGISPLNVFMKTFPAGTVSGAPKVRAMELIDQYEHSPRGFYAGCVGYFGYNGDLDTCITIRSALITKDKAIFRAGGGLVYDSVPENELKEVQNKLGAVFSAYRMVEQLEAGNVFTRR